MALMMRNRLNRIPLRTLYIRQSNDSRERAIGRKALDAAVKAGEGMDVEVRRKERFDINVAAALRNYAVDKEATEIMVGLHRKSKIVDTFYGSLVEQLVGLTDRMVIMSRCFIPVETVTKIVVVVPRNAEYETGFHLWVSRMATLAANIESRITFYAYRATQPLIQAAIAEDGVEVDVRYEVLDSYDDVILVSGDVAEDDLLVVIAARKGSISYGPDLEALPGFLSRYFSRHNLMVIYPRQF